MIQNVPMSQLLNPKREKFCHLIVAGELTQKDCYTAAGYSGNQASHIAHRLLKLPEIKNRIAEIQESVAKTVELNTGVTKSWVIENLKDIVEKAKQDVEVYDKRGKPTGKYVFQGMVANRALELIGKEIGMFSDKLKLSGDDENPIKLVVEYLNKSVQKVSHG
jgi:phage terminase small subunit